MNMENIKMKESDMAIETKTETTETVLETLEKIVHTNPYFKDLSEAEKEQKIWSFVQILVHH